MTVTARHWDSLCLAIERQDLIVDPRYETGEARIENGGALYEELAVWTRERTKHDVMECLGAAGVPCSASLDTRDLFTDPHLTERGFVHQIDHPVHGEKPLLGFAPRMSGSHVPIRRAPMLGEHTREVLSEELGLRDAELDAYREAGVLHLGD